MFAVLGLLLLLFLLSIKFPYQLETDENLVAYEQVMGFKTHVSIMRRFSFGQ